MQDQHQSAVCFSARTLSGKKAAGLFIYARINLVINGDHLMQTDRIAKQTEFLMELDKLKGVIRRNYINGGERRENTAEHSWHVALQALLFQEYANEPVQIDRVIRMLLIHDVVEILAGDTYIYAPGDPGDQAAKEQAAAETLFGLLPSDQSADLKDLWGEFEAIETPEARFAKAMDRFLPILQNYHAGGLSWREHHITPKMVEGIILKIKPGSEALWAYATQVLEQAVQQGLFDA